MKTYETLGSAIAAIEKYHGISRNEAIQAVADAEDTLGTDNLTAIVEYINSEACSF